MFRTLELEKRWLDIRDNIPLAVSLKCPKTRFTRWIIISILNSFSLFNCLFLYSLFEISKAHWQIFWFEIFFIFMTSCHLSMLFIWSERHWRVLLRDGEVAEALQVQVQAGRPWRRVQLLQNEPWGKLCQNFSRNINHNLKKCCVGLDWSDFFSRCSIL